MKINSDCFYESLIEDIYENFQGEISFADLFGETNPPPATPPSITAISAIRNKRHHHHHEL